MNQGVEVEVQGDMETRRHGDNSDKTAVPARDRGPDSEMKVSTECRTSLDSRYTSYRDNRNPADEYTTFHHVGFICVHDRFYGI